MRLTRTITLHLVATIAVIAIAADLGANIFFHASPRAAVLFGTGLLLLGLITAAAKGSGLKSKVPNWPDHLSDDRLRHFRL